MTDSTASTAVDAFSSHHQLTTQEARVARLIAEANTAGEIAGLLGVSVYTVRAHLRAIFAKTGVSRQAALVRLILTSREPSLPGSRRD